ncbi:MAG: DUF4153 domain-containing protein [Thalassotalea sp.]
MDNQLPKPLIIIISLIQGILLTLIYRSVENDVWPSTAPVWLVSLTTFVVVFPLLFLLVVTKKNALHAVKYLLSFTLLLSFLGAYVGFQQEPVEYVSNWVVVAVFSFTALIACFKALIYIQLRLSKESVTYSALFKTSWRNFIIFAESWLFVLIFWGILHLGSSLFLVLKIDVFQQLLKEDWFVIPVLTLAFGFATLIFRNIVDTVDNIATILQTLIKFLLPALTIVSLGFLSTLPFAGLDNLWETGKGSLLVMWLQALTLFFVNAVYQGASNHRPYHNILHRIIFIGIALLPIYSVISAYGLWLRIDQYGLSIDRCWAVLVCFILSCFSIGYLAGIINKRDAWLTVLSKVNIAMSLVILSIVLLVNTPLLNFQSIVASSQLSRLDNGDVTKDNFDYHYFGQQLGRQGYLAMQVLKETLKDTHPEKVIVIDRMYTNVKVQSKETVTQVEFEQEATFWPSRNAFSEEFIQTIYRTETEHKWSNVKKNSYYFLAIDLNGDGGNNFIVIKENNHSTSGQLWQKNNNRWDSLYMNSDNPEKIKYLKNLVLANEVNVKERKWKTLQIGDLTFKVAN